MAAPSGGDAPATSALRISWMHQFRGLTILLLFAVHYAVGFSWGPGLAPVFLETLARVLAGGRRIARGARGSRRSFRPDSPAGTAAGVVAD
jgi:hypothetical protein